MRNLACGTPGSAASILDQFGDRVNPGKATPVREADQPGAQTKDQHARAHEAHARRRRRAAVRGQPAAHRADRRPPPRPGTPWRRDPDRLLRATGRAAARPPARARGLPLRPPRPQGRGRGQRRHARLGGPAARPGRGRPPVPAVQGGGARRCSRRHGRRHVRATRATASSTGSGSCRPPATSSSAGCASTGPTARARLLRPPAVGLEGLRRGRDDGARRPPGLRRAVRVVAGAGPRLLGRPDRDRRLPRGGRPASTGRSRTFPEAYADQNERDYAALERAARESRGSPPSAAVQRLPRRSSPTYDAAGCAATSQQGSRSPR